MSGSQRSTRSNRNSEVRRNPTRLGRGALSAAGRGNPVFGRGVHGGRGSPPQGPPSASGTRHNPPSPDSIQRSMSPAKKAKSSNSAAVTPFTKEGSGAEAHNGELVNVHDTHTGAGEVDPNGGQTQSGSESSQEDNENGSNTSGDGATEKENHGDSVGRDDTDGGAKDTEGVNNSRHDDKDATNEDGARSDDDKQADMEGNTSPNKDAQEDGDTQDVEGQRKTTADEVQFIGVEPRTVEDMTNEGAVDAGNTDEAYDKEDTGSYMSPMKTGAPTMENESPPYFELPTLGPIAEKSYLILNGSYSDCDDSNDTPIGSNTARPSTRTKNSNNKEQQKKNKKKEDKRVLIRLFMKMKLNKETDLPDFDDVLAKYFNEFMDMFENLEPRVFLAPWEHTHAQRDKYSHNHISNQQGMYKRYLKTFTDNGTIVRKFNQVKFLRFQLSVPEKCDVQAILDDIENDPDNYWWDSEKRSVEIAPSQGINPVYILHFLRSCAINDGCRELEKVLRVVLDDPRIGVHWKICDRDKDTSAAATTKWIDYKKNPGLRKNLVRAVHIEVDSSSKDELLPRIQHMYSSGDYPLEWNFDPVVDLSQSSMRTLTSQQAYDKCLWHQEMFLPHLTSFDVVEFIHHLDDFLPAPYVKITLRRWLMHLRIRSIAACVDDRLFLSIGHFLKEGRKHVGLVCHKIVAEEAASVVNHLALVIRHEARVDPSLFLDHKVVLAQEADKGWQPDLREPLYKNGTAGAFAHILTRSTLHDIAVKVDNRKNNLSNHDLNQYNRANDNCDETVKEGRDNANAHAQKYRSLNGKTKRTFESKTVGGNAMSVDSSLTGGSKGSHTTGTTKSKRAKAALQAARLVASQRDQEHAAVLQRLEKKHAEDIETMRTSILSDIVSQLRQPGVDLTALINPPRPPSSPPGPPNRTLFDTNKPQDKSGPDFDGAEAH